VTHVLSGRSIQDLIECAIVNRLEHDVDGRESLSGINV